MFQQLKRLAGHSGIYGMGLLGSRIAALVLTPMFLHVMSRAEYGVMELLNNLSSMLTSVLILGAAGVLPKVYSCDCESDDERKEMLSSILAFSIVMSGLLIVFSWLFAEAVSKLLFAQTGYASLVRLAAASSGILVTQNMIMIFLRVKQWPLKFLIVSLLQVAIMMALNVYLVGFRHEGVFGVQVASVISCAVSFCVGLYMVRAYLVAALSSRLVRSVLKLSIPLIPAAVAPWVLNVSDRYFLNSYVGLAQTGLYAAGYKLAMTGMNLLINAFQLSWGPFFFGHNDDAEIRRLCSTVLKYYCLILCGFALLFSVFASDILRLISKREFWSAGWMVPYIALSYVLYGIQFYTVPLFIRMDHGKWLSVIMGGAAVTNLVLNWLLIPRFGIVGAVASTLVCFGLLCIVTIAVSVRIFYVEYDYSALAKVFGTSIVLFVLFHSIPGYTVAALLLKTLVIPAFLASLAILRFFEPTAVRAAMVKLKILKEYA
ncbi:MAG TPA: polysaccharide biosynthesis C-terminal domain-containing protein [Armatimonadota bacterium]|jgi:O-antigen/teichoic acid export membrane protein